MSGVAACGGAGRRYDHYTAHRDLFPQTLYRLLKLYKQMDIDTEYYIMFYICIFILYIGYGIAHNIVITTIVVKQ